MTDSQMTPIGSDFDSPGAEWLRTGAGHAPWEREARVVEYSQTARQALGAIAEVLSRRGYTRIAVPGHFCDSMIEPFTARGWRVEPVRMTESLSLDLADLERSVDGRQDTAVLAAEYFGRIPGAEYRDVMRAFQDQGVPVIEDETHRPLAPGGVVAEYRIASLRKVLPLAEGAYVCHDGEPLFSRELPVASSLRWDAMDAKRDGEPGADGATVRQLFERANADMESSIEPHGVTPRTAETIRRLDFEAFAARRLTNSLVLAAELRRIGLPMVNDPVSGGFAPSHLVIRISQAREAQAALARESIFCPIHWPRPLAIEWRGPWPDDLLSLPVDHRYTEADMARIADALERQQR